MDRRQVGRRILIDAVRYQLLYEQIQIWLDAHGIATSVLWSENFSVSWALRTLQSIGSRLNNTFSFWLVALVYVLLGLAETEEFRSRIKQLKTSPPQIGFFRLVGQQPQKFGSTCCSGGDEPCHGFPCLASDPSDWIAVLRNMGICRVHPELHSFSWPLVATLFITAFAFTHLADWQWVLALFVGLNVIQSVIGSVIEPRLTGKTLSLSPFATLFSVFAWGSLWGVFGAFIGVPITIVSLTFCAQYSSTSWFAEIFGFSRE